MQVRVRVRVMVRMGCGHDGLGRGGWRGVSGGGGCRRWAGSDHDGGLVNGAERPETVVCLFFRSFVCLCVFAADRRLEMRQFAVSGTISISTTPAPPPQPSPPAQKRNPSWSTSGATTGGRLPPYPLHGGLRSDREAPSGRFTPSSGGRLRASPGPARLAAAAAAAAR